MFDRIARRVAVALAPIAVFAAVSALASPAEASWFHGSRNSGCCSSCCGCGSSCCEMPACGGCTYQTVQKTIMVPTMVTEMQTVNCMEYRTEQRQRTCTVYKVVPETKMVQYQYTVMVPETHTETVNCVQYKTESAHAHLHGQQGSGGDEDGSIHLHGSASLKRAPERSNTPCASR